MRRLRCAAAFALIALAASLGDTAVAHAQAKKPRAGAKSTPAKPAAAWIFERRLGVPTLAYGAEPRDEYLIIFSCQPESGLLRVISSVGSRGLRPGDGAAIRLVNGKTRFEFAGTAFSTEGGRVIDIAAVTRFDSSLLALFRQGETLVVEVPGRRRSLPITNAKPAADAFEKACTASPRLEPGQ